MSPPQIRAIEHPPVAGGFSPAGTVDVQLLLADGTSSRFPAATPDQPDAWVEKAGKGYAFGSPALFVRGLEPALLRESADAMARDLGGYWLRYYNSLRRKRSGTSRPKPVKVSQASIASREPSGDPAYGSAVIQVTIEDGRIFSILSATPAWFKDAMEKRSLRFYFGPSVLFLRELDPALARRAVAEVASRGDHWLCLYDTPRTTISQILTDFKNRHP